MRSNWISLGVVTLCHVAFAQLKLVDIKQSDFLSIPATCFSVLTSEVNCPPVIIPARDFGGGYTHFYRDNDLSKLCASTCATGLTTWHRRVVGACANVRIPSSVGKLTLVAQFAQEYLEAQQTICLNDKDGKRCNLVMGSALGVNPSNQVVTSTPGSSALCEDCFLSMLSTQLALPLAATDSRVKTNYQYFTESCSKTGWTIPPTPSTTSWDIPVSTGAGPEPTCSGESVAVSGKSCQEISMTNKVSTRRLLEVNNLAGNCYQFPKSGNVCIPSDSICTPYTVKEDDTCSSLARVADVPQAQVIGWNYELDIGCANIKNLVGNVICVSQPGGAWQNPDPPPPSTTSIFESIPPLATMSDIMDLPQPTRLGWNNSEEIAPFAEGTRLDCDLYVQAPILKDWTTGEESSSCADVAKGYNIDVDQLTQWNPSLEGDCVLKDDVQYCVQLEPQTATEITDKCSQYAFARPGNDCGKFVSLYGLDRKEFVAWNPIVGTNCGDFKTGISYCIDVWKYRQSGIVSTCNQFTIANNTRWTDEPCRIIEDKYGVGHARFVAWNPAVLSNCTGLYRNYEYCVSIPGYKPTFTATAAKASQT